MAHVVRNERPRQNGHALDAAGEVSIDLRHGDLSDDEVVAVLLQLARERASSDGDATRANGNETVVAPRPAPARPRHRSVPALTTLAVVGALAIVLVGVLIVLGVSARQTTAASPVLAGAAGAGPGPSTVAVPSTNVRTPPSTSRPAPTTPPSTVPAPITTAAAATAAGAAAEPTTSFCRAVSIYTLDNLITLAENGVRDPQGTIAAFGTMVANAPPEIADDVTALGPITGKVQAEIEAGRITTPEQMQQYLAGGAPADEVATWIVAQQAIVAELPTLCPGRPTP